jgi:hypothetical protein
MRKFRASLKPFWDLKIGKYVEHLMPVSSEYLISCELLFLMSTAGRTSHLYLAYVIPWRSCAIYSTHSSVPRSTDLKFRSCRVRSYIGTCHYRGRESVSLWLRHRYAALCTHYIDDLLPHAPLCRHGQFSFHSNDSLVGATNLRGHVFSLPSPLLPMHCEPRRWSIKTMDMHSCTSKPFPFSTTCIGFYWEITKSH